MNLNIPTKWSDISISQYIQLYELDQEAKELKEEDITFELSKNEIFLRKVAILLGKKVSEVEQISVKEFNQISDDLLSFQLQEPNHMVNLDDAIMIDGVKYYFNKNLDSLCLGEMVDIEEFNKDVVNNLHNIAGVLFRKEGQVGYSRDNAMIFFNKMNVEVVMSGVVFFWIFANDYLMSDIPNCSLLDRMIMGMTKLKMELKEKSEEHLTEPKTS